MTKAFRSFCHRSAVEAFSALNDEVPFRFPKNTTFKNEPEGSKFPAATEVRARMCLNKILSPKEWATILDMTPQSVNRLRSGDRILPEHQDKIFKVFLAVTDGMLLQAHDIRKNTPQVNDWVQQELKIIEEELS